MNRRTYLKSLSGMAGLAAIPTAVTAEEYPEWDPDSAYTKGDRVTYEGTVYEAKWWTQGDEPGSSQWGPWKEIDDSDDDNGDDDDGDDDTGDVDCSGVGEWSSSETYTGGDQVVHDGVLYEASWWTQGDEPGSSQWGPWEKQGACGSNDGPTASFTVDPTSPMPGDEVTLDASGSSDADGTIDSYTWDIEGVEGTQSGEMTTVTFDTAGSYDVTLTVTDDAGATASTTETVTVGETNDGPTASFTVDPTSPMPGDEVTLDASDSADADGSIDSYEWDIEGVDGTPSGEMTTVTFDSTGTYDVTLTVTDNDGGTSSTTKTVSVTEDSGDLTESTTLAELFPGYKERHVDDVFLDFMPDDFGGGSGETTWSDSAKADAFNVDLEAIRNNVEDGSLQFGSLGTQALPWAQQLRDHGVPDHAIAQLLPRLMLLPDETEELQYQLADSMEMWDETAGPVAASNDPSLFYQDDWPNDARGEDDQEVAERDRVYLQAQTDDAWSGDFQYLDNYDSKLLDTLQNNTHPATDESLGGDTFTANAPMEVEAEIHQKGAGYSGQMVLKFTNTSPVPYHLDGAVIWWMGPSNYGRTMGNGAYNNEQRPQPGYGHPQRDIIEITLPDEHVPDRYADIEQDLSAYALRPAFHDSPYNMRTAYPNQKWSLEVSLGRYQNPLSDAFSSATDRQRIVDMMAETAHVELETDMDLNDDVVDAIELYNREGN